MRNSKHKCTSIGVGFRCGVNLPGMYCDFIFRVAGPKTYCNSVVYVLQLSVYTEVKKVAGQGGDRSPVTSGPRPFQYDNQYIICDPRRLFHILQ